jgi:hypothetical protein
VSGADDGAEKAVGHSDDSPFDVNLTIYFPDVPDAITIGCFTNCTDKEWQSSQQQKLPMGKDGWIGLADLNTTSWKVCFSS